MIKTGLGNVKRLFINPFLVFFERKAKKGNREKSGRQGLNEILKMKRNTENNISQLYFPLEDKKSKVIIFIIFL